MSINPHQIFKPDVLVHGNRGTDSDDWHGRIVRWNEHYPDLVLVWWKERAEASKKHDTWKQMQSDPTSWWKAEWLRLADENANRKDWELSKPSE